MSGPSWDKMMSDALRWYREVKPQLIREAIEGGMRPSLIEYWEAGGSADFTFFENVRCELDTARSSIETHFKEMRAFKFGPLGNRLFVDKEALLDITPAEISRREFYGSHFDYQRMQLVFEAPVGACVEPGKTRGEYAYAFTDAPHPPRLSKSRFQEIFNELDAIMFPGSYPAIILDWSSPKLIQVSNYFEEGFEWWGAFLFTVSIPSQRKITVISASNTD
jgi:hypothetical protein